MAVAVAGAASSRSDARTLAAWAFGVLLVQAAVALWIGLPGQMSTDSIIQLYEGRTHQTISFNPPLLSIVLGLLDRLGSGPVGFVLISQALLSGATWLVLVQAGSSSRWRYGLATLCLLNPVMLAYVGIVWKDVLFAHAAVLLFLALEHWRVRGVRIGLGRMVFVVVLMTVIVGARQQGVLFSVVAALWVASMLKHSRTGKVVAALALVIAPIAANRMLSELVQKPLQDPVNGAAVGFKILMHYDLVGILANQGQLARGTAKEVVVEAQAQVPRYIPYRVDTLTGSTAHYWSIPMAQTVRLWTQSILESPGAYLRHRARLAGAFLGLDDMRRCSPVYSGVGGPIKHPLASEELTAMLGLQPGLNHSSRVVNAAGWVLAQTPLLMHWAYVLVLAGVCVVLLRRRALVLLSLAACSLGLLASYFVLGIACDFRYAYTLTVATSLLAAWALLAQPKTAVLRT